MIKTKRDRGEGQVAAPAPTVIQEEEEPLQKKRFLTGRTTGKRPYLR